LCITTHASTAQVLPTFIAALLAQGLLEVDVQVVRRVPPARNLFLLLHPVNPSVGRPDFREWLDSPDWVRATKGSYGFDQDMTDDTHVLEKQNCISSSSQ
jgi:hypothetical protein